MGARDAAVNGVLAVVRDGRSLTNALPDCLAGLEGADRSLAQALTYGVLRHRRRLEAVADGLLAKPLRSRDRDVYVALLIGLYQLSSATTPAHAAVSETAEVARSLRKAWAVGLLNGTLRRFQRECDRRLAAVDREPALRWSLPDWLLQAWQTDWPDHWSALAEASNAQAPMTLRVNRRLIAVDDYAARLAAAGYSVRALPGLPDALTLETPMPVDELPGFSLGQVSVQDGAAQYAAALVDPQPGERVLDACAAPGGKTDHLHALCPDAEIVALDHDSARLESVRSNLERLGGRASLLAGDAGAPGDWWDGRRFDRILLDAPCSATGVIRRHPDIKWLRRASDIASLAAEQRRLIAALWRLLAPGGRMIYATCSVMRAENEDVVADVAGTNSDVIPEPPGLSTGSARGVGHQILTGEAGMDGFYYACLRKG
jgi:16S rRNA (cytosine967-C5)-methyltransferase